MPLANHTGHAAPGGSPRPARVFQLVRAIRAAVGQGRALPGPSSGRTSAAGDVKYTQ